MKKLVQRKYFVILTIAGFLFLVTCEKPEHIIKLTTLDIEAADISFTSAKLKGEITDLGSTTIEDHGILVSDNTTPDEGNSTVKSLGGTIQKGVFEVTVTELTANKTYYFRAFVKAGGEEFFSNAIKQFTTLAYSLPTVTTTSASLITATTAASGGDITADGGASITARGVCWSTSANPTTADTKTTDGSGTGTFTSNIAGLTDNTTYHARAYATNVAGTAYGSDVTFTTIFTVVVPVVSTLSVTSIGTTSATGGGSVSDAGHGTVTARGVCWAQYANPVTADFTTVDGEGTGSFLSSMTNLTPSTTYHVRAYATNPAGTAYGSDITFTTKAAVVIPTVTTASVTSIGSTIATSGGSITSDGGGTITGKGVCFSTSANPTTNDQKTIDGTGTDSFVSSISGLTASTIYHVRAYATNSAGTGYGSDITFTTSASATVPTVTTTAISAITMTGASSGGNVTSEGGSSVTARGVCWSTNTNPVATGNHTTDATGSGVFTSGISGLTADTRYYVRAYATNSAGTGYGSELQFTSLCNQPLVTANAASNISLTTATLNGTINADNVSTIPLFQYGTTTSYGSTINSTPYSVDGSTNTAISLDIINLSPGTLYHYRVVASFCGVDVFSNDQTFTTNAVNASTVTTTAISGITSTGATSGGNVTSEGGSSVTARGVCWSTNTNPVATGNHTTDANGSGVFMSSITGLTSYTDYYVRAYATNSAGTSYGEELQFTTLCTPPTLTANAASNISYTTATLNGTVNANGFATSTYFQYGTTTSYGTSVLSSPTSADGTSTTAISVNLNSLTSGTLYHYRVMGTSCGVVSYSDDLTFTASALGAPAITTTLVNSITGSTASSGGTITSDGGAAVTISGICWSTASNPTVFDSKTTDGTTTGTFTSALNGLNPNTLYYVRAYATNSNGIGYGNQVSFTTLQLPTVTTDAASPITSTTSSLNGTVNANGTDTDVIFEYGTSTSYGSTANASPSPVTGTANRSVSAAITGLTTNTTYHFRVKAVSIAGTTYGNDQIFITLCVAPAASVNAATNLGGTTATLNGYVNANSFSTTVTFEYGPTTSFGSTTDATPNIVTGSGSTAVSAAVTGLLTNTIYYYRIKAVNCGGTTYSSETSLTTLQPPTATTSAATSIAYTTANLNGLVNANNSASTITFEYGLNTSYGTTVSATPGTVAGNIATVVSAAISGLTTGTTYHYRVKAVSSGGSDDGDDMTFATTVPPTVTSITANPIATTSATLNCSVNPNGQSSDVSFEYGLSTSYGSTANGTPLTVIGTSATAVSASISGLSVETTYHYRVKTVSLGVTYYTSDNTFITLCNTPSATTNAASDLTNTTATFNGVANANGFSTTVTFDWGTDITYGTSKDATPWTVEGSSNTSVTGAITGLSPNTTYHYRVKTVNCGGTVYGEDKYFTTLCTAPTATADLATNITVSSARMWGTVNANNFSTTVIFEYGLPPDYGISVPASPNTVTGTSNTPVMFDVTGLPSNTTYNYRVKAVNCNGTPVYGSGQFFTTLCPASIIVVHVAGSVSPVAKTVTYGIIQSGLTNSATCWIDRNLGATNQATSATDATEASAGWHWQFNRLQGYKHDGSLTPNVTWPTPIDENSDWTAGNDPCTILLGTGWRIPTRSEWTQTDNYSGWVNYTSTYASAFKIHAAGQIISGNLSNRGSIGSYWSSSQALTTTGYSFVISSSSSSVVSSNNKATNGNTLRCLRD